MADCRLVRCGRELRTAGFLLLISGAFVVSLAAATDQFSVSPVPLGQFSPESKKDRPSSESLGVTSADSAGRRSQDLERFLARQTEQWEENAQFWTDEISKAPTTIFYYRRLLLALSKLDRCDEMRAWTGRVLEFDPLDSYARWVTGACCYKHDRFQYAVDYLEPSTWFDPSNFYAQRDLGYCLYHLHSYHRAADALKFAADLRPDDFGVNYWLGVSLAIDRDYKAAIAPLTRAIELRENDSLPFHWRGFANARLGHYAEAIPDLEKALALKSDDRSTRSLLFGAYLFVGEVSKATDLFPVLVQVATIVLVALYLMGLVPLLWLSFRRSNREFPNVFLPIGWTLVMVEGQIALLLLLGLLGRFRPLANPVGAVLLAESPILVGAAGFARKRWGAPFARPFRFGGSGVILRGFGLLLCVLVMNGALALLAGQNAPLQNTIPIFRTALMKAPIISAFAIALVIPAAEEILFRGLLFGALQRWLRSRLTIVITAFLFAAFHGQPRIMIQLFIFGCVLGWARSRTGSIALPFLLHAANNCVAVIAILNMPAP
jgi:membrane protease YdiL (CAAX protease family)